MRTCAITPLEGVGPVRFGMSRRDVRAALGEDPRPFRKTADAKHEADAFERAGLRVHYGGDAPGVEFVEALPTPDVAFALAGLDVFARPADEVRAALAAQTEVIEEDGGRTYVLPEWDVSLWRPEPDAPHFTEVAVAEPGYDHLGAV